MTCPRQQLPGAYYLITRSCLLRMYLLKPCRKTNQAFIYCMAVAAKRTNVQILLPYAASNHEHIVAYDPDARISEFLTYFHALFARCQNAHLGRRQNLWAAEEPCVTRLLDRAAVIKELIYTAANPVKDYLVERAHQWPGVNGYSAFIRRRPLEARRPAWFFRNHGDMPKTVTLELSIPPGLGPADEVIAAVKAGVEAIEQTTLASRLKSGRRIVGCPALRALSWSASPSSPAPTSTLRPRFAGRPESRIHALLSYKLFVSTYRDAFAQWRAGEAATFPPGTCALARSASIRVQPCPGPAQLL